jgi:superfamily II DNA or RNA helicase
MRLSTAMTPRVIACAEELPQHIALPRGCRAALEELLHEYGVALVVEDLREEGAAVPFWFQGELTVLQQQAARALLRHETGVLVAPPGVGKTVLGTHLIAERDRSTLVLVHRQPLLDQWITQPDLFEARRRSGASAERRQRATDVALIQVDRKSVNDSVARFAT